MVEASGWSALGTFLVVTKIAVGIERFSSMLEQKK